MRQWSTGLSPPTYREERKEKEISFMFPQVEY